jgi:hypothetical protein
MNTVILNNLINESDYYMNFLLYNIYNYNQKD